MVLNFNEALEILWSFLWQVTLLIPLAIWGVRTACRRRSHLGYLILLAVLAKCVVPPIWSSPTGVFSWVAFALQESDEQELGVVAQSSSTAGVHSQHDGGMTDFPLPVRHNDITVPAEIGVPARNKSATLATPSSSISSPGPSSVSHSVEGTTPMESLPVTSTGQQPADHFSFQWGPSCMAVLLVVWGGGIIWLIGYLFAKRILLERFHDDTRIDTAEELLTIVSECSSALELQQVPDLLVTTHPTIPFVVGWWSPRLVIPRYIVERSTADDLRLIVSHELNHLRRWDTVVNWFQLGVQSLWWFHPLVWKLNAEIRRWRETCCDEEVVARLHCQPARYAHCLLNVLELQTTLKPISGFSNLSPFEVTKQRLQNIMQAPGVFSRSTPWSVWISFLLLTTILLPGAAHTFTPSPLIANDGNSEGSVNSKPSTIPSPSPVTEGLETHPVSTASKPADSNTCEQEPPAPPVPSDLPSPANSAPPIAWKYKFDVHRTYQYAVSIEESGPSSTIRYTGSPTVQATYLSGQQWQLEIRNARLQSIEDPSPNRPFGRGFDPPSIPGPFARAEEVTIDAFGNLVEETVVAPLPLTLGKWSNWLFRPLPAPDRPLEWTDRTETQLTRNVDPVGTPFGPSRFSGPWTRTIDVERLPADVELATKQEVLDGRLTLTQSRRVGTKDLVDGAPRFESQCDTVWIFDPQLGVPVTLDGQGVLILRQSQTTTRIPYTLTVKLQQDLPVAGVQQRVDSPAEEPKPKPPSNPTVGIAPPSHQGAAPNQSQFLREWTGNVRPGDVVELPGTGGTVISIPSLTEEWREHDFAPFPQQIVPRQSVPIDGVP